VSVYAADHADALEMIREAGSAVTFQTGTPGTHDPATGTFTSPTSTTVTGYAMRVSAGRDDEVHYRAEGLTVGEVITLVFAPTTMGQLPTLGATVSWASETLTVRALRPTAPNDEGAIIAKVGCVR
jgi:hypothetical protein